MKILLKKALKEQKFHWTESGPVLQYGSFFFPQCSPKDAIKILDKLRVEQAELIFPLDQGIPLDFLSMGSLSSRYHFEPLDWKTWSPANIPIPKTLGLRLAEADDYQKLVTEHWSQDLAIQIPEEEFRSQGFTLMVEHGEEIVAGAGVYARLGDHIEIEIDVREDFQGRGIGAWLSLEYLLECKKRKLIPHWDAMTEISKNLALKSGFLGVREYPIIRWSP